MDPLEEYQEFYQKDPLSFNKGFARFCEHLNLLYSDFIDRHPEKSSYAYGYKFAASSAYTHIQNVIRQAFLAAKLEELEQRKIREDLERLFKM